MLPSLGAWTLWESGRCSVGTTNPPGGGDQLFSLQLRGAGDLASNLFPPNNQHLQTPKNEHGQRYRLSDINLVSVIRVGCLVLRH